jgi:hypothetical protein
MEQWAKDECAWCGNPLPLKEWCGHCTQDIKARRKSKDMTTEERIAELRTFFEGTGQFLMVPFDVLHERVQELMARPVWTHELARPQSLIAELEGTKGWSGPVGSLIDIIGEDRAGDVIVVQS